MFNNSGSNKTPGEDQPKNGKNPKKFFFNINLLYTVIAAILIGLYFSSDMTSTKEVKWSEFQEMVEKNYVEKLVIISNKNLMEVYIKPSAVESVFKQDSATVGEHPKVLTQISSSQSPENYLTKKTDDLQKEINIAINKAEDDKAQLLTQNLNKYKIDISYKEEKDVIGNVIWSILPFALMIGIWFFLMRRMSGGGSGSSGVFNVGKSQAQLFDKNNQNKKNFKDVAGLAEAKQEVEEIVEFLKNPRKFTELGGKIPKGALLVGPPGTGKTLLAKAVAGEADVPFFSLSGSDFVEMFVGVGASRVRDLFRQAKEKSPCIIFIDEIDAIGRARGKNVNMGGNDERENTLNQLLTEMDGFGTNSGIIILAATNRADILDKALLRAGRFDRQIYVDLPDINDRKDIFGVHLRPIKIDETVSSEILAKQTPGFSGADIANVCNEAALIAARKGKNFVQKEDFNDAIDRIVGGLEKKNKVYTADEKKAIAIHEAGHATVSWMLQYANPLVKVTIVPRGKALGAAWYMPEERQITTKEQMLDEMCAILGGRAAEEVFIGPISSGAFNDLQRANRAALSMVSFLGMSPALYNFCSYNPEAEYSFQKPYSEKTAELIDKEVAAMIGQQYQRAKSILEKHEEGHHAIANLLIEKEVIFAEDVEKILGKRLWASRMEEIMENQKNEPTEQVAPIAEPIES